MNTACCQMSDPCLTSVVLITHPKEWLSFMYLPTRMPYPLVAIDGRRDTRPLP